MAGVAYTTRGCGGGTYFSIFERDWIKENSGQRHSSFHALLRCFFIYDYFTNRKLNVTVLASASALENGQGVF